MTEKEKSQLPKGWVEKYWGYFSEDIKYLIKLYLKNEIGDRKFWLGIENLMNHHYKS
jgi:hypothetical protein